METITIMSRKGGSGKTSTALGIGGALQRMGKSVLFVDLDSQCNLTAAMRGDPAGLNITNLLGRGADLPKVVQGTPNGDLIPGSIFLAGADLAMDSDTELAEALAPLKGRFAGMYDFVMLDTGASYGRLTRNALQASTGAIVTAQATTFSRQGLADAAGIIRKMQTSNTSLSFWGVVVTSYSGRGNIAKRLLDEMRAAAAELGTRVIEPPVRQTVRVIESQAAGVNIVDYAPRSTAAEDYTAIAEWILSNR